MRWGRCNGAGIAGELQTRPGGGLILFIFIFMLNTLRRPPTSPLVDFGEAAEPAAHRFVHLQPETHGSRGAEAHGCRFAGAEAGGAFRQACGGGEMRLRELVAV